MNQRLARILLMVAGTGGLTGCAGTYDMLTSQRFRERPFATLFSSDDPVWVLENVNDGDERVRAMRRLSEPSSANQRDKVIEILSSSATTDRQPMIRLAAIGALSDFEDPRASQILVSAYNNAPHENPQQKNDIQPAGGLNLRGSQSGFTPDTVLSIQCLVLESLSKHRSPDSLKLLCDVALNGPKLPAKSKVEPMGYKDPLAPESGLNTEDGRDVRLAAIRALRTYERETQAIQTLIEVLKRERDVALRSRAHESLTLITGQDFPADAAVWNEWVTKGMPAKKGLLGF